MLQGCLIYEDTRMSRGHPYWKRTKIQRTLKSMVISITVAPYKSKVVNIFFKFLDRPTGTKEESTHIRGEYSSKG